jgi:restriction endonuclease S subunit
MKKGFEELAETAKAEFEAERLETHKELLCGKWPCELLKKHVDVLAGYAFQSKGFVESGIRVCGGLIISPDRIKWEECKYWKSSSGIEQYLLQDKDIVIALDRPWISGGFKMGVICKRDLPCLLIQRTARLRMKDVDFRYVMMLLRDESFKSHCTTSGTTVPHISHKDIETYEIPFPPERVQKAIADRLFVAKTRAEKLEAKAREGVAVCETMRKAILKEAFDLGRKG